MSPELMQGSENTQAAANSRGRQTKQLLQPLQHQHDQLPPDSPSRTPLILFRPIPIWMLSTAACK